jgi:hypothetical protein
MHRPYDGGSVGNGANQDYAVYMVRYDDVGIEEGGRMVMGDSFPGFLSDFAKVI